MHSRSLLSLILLAAFQHRSHGLGIRNVRKTNRVGISHQPQPQQWWRDGWVAGSTYRSTAIFSQPPGGDDHDTIPGIPVLSEEMGFVVRRSVPWTVFGGIVVGMGRLLHTAATHAWLSIPAGTWGAVSVALPAITVGACLFQLFFLYGSSDPTGLIVHGMHGRENEDADLAKALSGVYREAGFRNDTDLPRLFVVPSREPNAFATGTIEEGSVVAVTTGLLDALTPREVRAVLAHEVGHIRHRDTEIAAQIASMLGALAFVMDCGGLLMDVTRGVSSKNSEDSEEDDDGIDLHAVGWVLYMSGLLTYCTGTLLRLFASRQDEYNADAFARSIGEGPALASALKKIDERGTEGVKEAREDDSALGAMNGAYAHAYINNPPSRDSPFINLFGLLRTHPSIEDRIQKLTEQN